MAEPRRARRLTVAVAAWLAAGATGADVSAGGVPVTYTGQVREVLQRYCVECHSGWFPKAGLRLDSLPHIMEGGRSGPAIVPGDPAKGWLTRSLGLPAQSPAKMPPGRDMSRQDIELLIEWIRQGAR
jgi:mono/diheme cytochrome c family protein